MKIILPSELELQIRAHGEKSYPHECCGIVAGTVQGETRHATEVRALTNLRETAGGAEFIEAHEGESAANRFFIDPREQMKVERELEKRRLAVLGFYHSHPNVAARPSKYDLDHAWPFYTYIIVSVRNGTSAEMTAWLLRDDRSAFDDVPIEFS